MPTALWSSGAAYIDGRYMPIEEAAIPITDWGYRRSDVTYDVVGVWDGAFFRLDDHLRRFRASMRGLRLEPPESDDQIRSILNECVRRSGLRQAYVAMDCLRGRPRPGEVRHPVNCRNYLTAFAIPWVWVMEPEMQERGAPEEFPRPAVEAVPRAEAVENRQSQRADMIGVARLLVITGAQDEAFLHKGVRRLHEAARIFPGCRSGVGRAEPGSLSRIAAVNTP